MQSLSDQEMTTLLGLVSKASHDQLRKVGEHIRSVSDLRSRQATLNFSPGTKVKWNGKHGPKTGVVQQVKQKYVLVLEDGGKNLRWNVPAAMLWRMP